MLENKDEIVLDKTNNVFVGPHEYFKLVVDSFDGKTIAAWHLEDKDGNKTPNLAERAKGSNMDLVVGAKCRSTGHFFSRVYAKLYEEAMTQNNAK